MCPPSLSCTRNMVVQSSFAPRQIAMARFVPTMCHDRMRMGGPLLAPNAAARLFSDDGSLVRPLGKEPRGSKAPATKSTKESVSWRRKSRICSSSWPSQLRQQDKAKLIPLSSTTLTWTPVRVRSTPCARRSKISRPIWRGPTLWIRGDRTSLLAASRGTLRLCSNNSTQQLGSWKGAKPLRNAWQLPSSVRLSASKQKKPQLTWLRVPNSLWSWPPRRRRRQSKLYELLRMAKATAEVGALAAQRANGAVRAASLADPPMKPLPVSFGRTMPRICGWREQNIQSPPRRQRLQHSPDSRANPALHRRRAKLL